MVVRLLDVVVVEGEEEKEEVEEGEVEEEQVVGEGGDEAVAVDEWAVEEVGEVDEITVVGEGEDRRNLAHTSCDASISTQSTVIYRLQKET